MDPFRDELAAAHARIARLEQEIASLRSLGQRRPARPTMGVVALSAGGLVAAGIAVLGGVGVLRARPRSVAASDGIATAQLPEAPPQLPFVDVQTRP